MKVELPLGDVVDKISILRIKAARIQDKGAVANVKRELKVLQAAWSKTSHPPIELLPEWASLLRANTRLWDVEDALREKERKQDFGPEFVELARSVYRLNDKRASLKKQINLFLGSHLVEEKSYTSY